MRAYALVVLASGCVFGGGPTPGMPAEARVLLVTPPVSPGQECTQSQYIGAVDLDGDQGFAVLLPFQPNNSDCNGGSAPVTQLQVLQFPTDGSNVRGMNVQGGQAGMSNSGPTLPEITIGNNGMRFVYSQSGSVVIGPENALVTGLANVQNGGPVGIASAGQTVYLALVGGGGGCPDDPGSPSFPNGCNQQGQSSGLFTVQEPLPMNMQVNATQISTENNFFSDQAFDVIATNSTTAFYFLHTNGQGAAIFSAANGASTDTQIATMPDQGETSIPGDLAPVGIDADDTHVVWAGAPVINQSNSPVEPGCYIWSHDLSSGMTTLIFHTQQIACLGGRLDQGFFYFAIVSNGTNSNCGGCTPPIHGDGLGRVALGTTPVFESIATGFSEAGGGPRRVYVDYSGPNVYAVDPNALAKIDKSNFMGRHDFEVESDATAPMP